MLHIVASRRMPLTFSQSHAHRTWLANLDTSSSPQSSSYKNKLLPFYSWIPWLCRLTHLIRNFTFAVIFFSSCPTSSSSVIPMKCFWDLSSVREEIGLYPGRHRSLFHSPETVVLTWDMIIIHRSLSADCRNRLCWADVSDWVISIKGRAHLYLEQ